MDNLGEFIINCLSIYAGMTNPEDIAKLRNHVISRLATAFSLEKMRRALEKLTESVELERHLNHNDVGGEYDKSESDDDDSYKLEDTNKRVAMKKDKVEYDNNR